MKHKTRLITVLLLLLLSLAACNPSPANENGEDLELQVVNDKVSTENCSKAGPGTSQLIHAAQGVCFIYPDNYEVSLGEDGALLLYVESQLNTEAPLVIIQFPDMDRRTIQEVIPDYPSDEDLAAMSFLTIDLGGETATVLDNIPGQDISRHVITVQAGRVIDIMIARFGSDYGAVGKQAEDLYLMITNSFQFIGIEPDANVLITK